MFKACDYLISIVETRSYSVDADRVFTFDEQTSLAEFLATNPHFGDVIPATGGVRKLRWRAKGVGKRGGARVIYYFRDLNMPVFLLAVFTKGERADLSAGDRKAMSQLVEKLVEQYRPKWERIVRLTIDAS